MYKELIKKREDAADHLTDYHVLRFFAVLIAVSKAKVIDMMGEPLQYCPLVKMLYKNMRSVVDVKEEIKEIIEKKIDDFGFFTPQRKFDIKEIAIPFGASEMLMYALRKKVIDAAVVVCDGAGSVIVTSPEMVQGIGARMNGLFFTTPITEIIQRIEDAGCRVPFSDASIDQIRAVKKACEAGYKNIAVTINGCVDEEKLYRIKALEQQFDVHIIVLVVCTTGASYDRIQEIADYADIVWSCASEEVREVVGGRAILQISKKIPVFVLTSNGLKLVSAYSKDEGAVNVLDGDKQYILSTIVKGKEVVMGDKFLYYLSETRLPVRSKGEPRFAEKEIG